MAEFTDIRFGNPKEWEAFGERNVEFLRRFAHLKNTVDKAFVRQLTDLGRLETILFFTSRQAVDDFFEILLLCGNAEGPGGEKLLRSYFERVVLILYLHKHPEKVDEYFDYYYVSDRKTLDSATRVWGKEAFDKAKIAEAEANYERVKNKFKGRKCKNCGYEEKAIAWSPVALGDMATAVGLGNFVFLAYTMPLLNAHPSMKGTLQRLEGNKAEGSISFGDRLNRDLADRVLSTAHVLLLFVLVVQHERFKVEGLDKMTDQAHEDYLTIWKRQAPKRP
jgi:hypothetical protein